MVRIAFVGAQGTGKTTLILALQERLKKEGYAVEHVEETARKCPFPIDTGATFAAEFHMMSTQINEENLKELQHLDVLLTDRCVVDQYVYWSFVEERLRKEAEGLPGAAKEARLARIQQERAIIEAIFKNWMPRIQRVLFVDISEESWRARVLQDGVRSTDPGWFKALRERFKVIAGREGVPLTILHNDGPFEETVSKALELIRSAISLQKSLQ